MIFFCHTYPCRILCGIFVEIAMDSKIIEAVKAVRDGMRVPDASTQFRFPIQTLYRRLKKLIPVKHRLCSCAA